MNISEISVKKALSFTGEINFAVHLNWVNDCDPFLKNNDMLEIKINFINRSTRPGQFAENIFYIFVIIN